MVREFKIKSNPEYNVNQTIGKNINPFLHDEYDLIERALFNQNNSKNYCSLGTITAINSSPVSVDIQPVINYFDKLDGFKTPPILKKIPVAQISNGMASLKFPLSVGNVGVILWLDREGYSWLDSSTVGPKAPDSGNLINDSACLFIPIFQKFSNAPTVKNLGVDIVSSNISLLQQLLTLLTNLTTFCTSVSTATTTNPLTPAYSAQLAAAASTLSSSISTLSANLTTFKGDQ